VGWAKGILHVDHLGVNSKIILSGVLVTIDGIWISEWIYSPHSQVVTKIITALLLISTLQITQH
jgi:hypothetical protein